MDDIKIDVCAESLLLSILDFNGEAVRKFRFTCLDSLPEYLRPHAEPYLEELDKMPF